MRTISLRIKKDYALRLLKDLEKSDAISLLQNEKKSALRKRRTRKSKKGFFLTAGLWKDRDVTLQQVRAKAFPVRK